MAVGGTPASPAFTGSWYDAVVDEDRIAEVRRVLTNTESHDQAISRTITTYVQQKITSAENIIGLSSAVEMLNVASYFPLKMPLSTSGDSFAQPDTAGAMDYWYSPRISQVKVKFSPLGVAECTAVFIENSPSATKLGDPIKRKLIDGEETK
jgi:hypothetical protein